jgi:type III secretion system YscQ/HrcQ family protein
VRAAALVLTVVAAGGAVTLASTELAALRRGARVLLARLAVSGAAGAWHGRVGVHAAQGGAGAILCRVRDAALIVEDFEAFAPSQEPNMTQGRRIPPTEPAPALAALADVPVQLSLELGRFAVTLHELSALRAGDVLVSGLKIGQRVALRAGAQLVATGELVEHDDELAVRIEALAE